MDTRERKCRAPRPQLLLLHSDQDVGAVGARQVNGVNANHTACSPRGAMPSEHADRVGREQYASLSPITAGPAHTLAETTVMKRQEQC